MAAVFQDGYRLQRRPSGRPTGERAGPWPAGVAGTRRLKRVPGLPPLVSEIELSLPDETYTELQQLVDQEFVSEEQAVEELLSLGIESYDTTVVDDEEEYLEGAETNVFDTADDPGSLDDDAL
jgi:hypothetical protein